MSELKTLKDLGINNEMATIVSKQELRAEAVKWVRAFREKEEWHYSIEADRWNPKNRENHDYSGYKLMGIWWESWEEGSDVEGAIKMLMLFFNLTEEDLEEKGK